MYHLLKTSTTITKGCYSNINEFTVSDRCYDYSILKLSYFYLSIRFVSARNMGKFFCQNDMKMTSFLLLGHGLLYYFKLLTDRSSISSFLLCNSWDEWAGLERLLKFTDENVQKQLELNEKQGTDKKAARASQIKPKHGNRWFV